MPFITLLALAFGLVSPFLMSPLLSKVAVLAGSSALWDGQVAW